MKRREEKRREEEREEEEEEDKGKIKVHGGGNRKERYGNITQLTEDSQDRFSVRRRSPVHRA